MSWKSVRFSIYAVVAFILTMFAIIFAFKAGILFGILSIFLLAIPAMLQRKAVDEAGGTIDKVLAKFMVPALAVVITLGFIMSVAFWI